MHPARRPCRRHDREPKRRMHPILEEMARAREVQPHAVRRWVEALAAHVAQLEAEIERLKDKAAEPVMVSSNMRLTKGRAS